MTKPVRKEPATVGETLSTSDLIIQIAEQLKETGEVVPRRQVEAVINMLKSVCMASLANGVKVQMTGFLNITPVYRAARTGNNVLNNAPLEIPETIAVTVKPGKQLRDSLQDVPKAVFASLKERATKAKDKANAKKK